MSHIHANAAGETWTEDYDKVSKKEGERERIVGGWWLLGGRDGKKNALRSAVIGFPLWYSNIIPIFRTIQYYRIAVKGCSYIHHHWPCSNRMLFQGTEHMPELMADFEDYTWPTEGSQWLIKGLNSRTFCCHGLPCIFLIVVLESLLNLQINFCCRCVQEFNWSALWLIPGNIRWKKNDKIT